MKASSIGYYILICRVVTFAPISVIVYTMWVIKENVYTNLSFRKYNIEESVNCYTLRGTCLVIPILSRLFGNP